VGAGRVTRPAGGSVGAAGAGGDGRPGTDPLGGRSAGRAELRSPLSGAEALIEVEVREGAGSVESKAGVWSRSRRGSASRAGSSDGGERAGEVAVARREVRRDGGSRRREGIGEEGEDPHLAAAGCQLRSLNCGAY
jgi:hypothetical protein